MQIGALALLLVNFLLVCPNLTAQHLWWNLEGQRDATCLYGEITVLATSPGIYYCGANWHPGEPAGGYCGIQHNSLQERRTIFSIWDTSAQLHPKVTEADPRTVFNRFGGEGDGAHTHMVWPWNTNELFQFFVQKQPGSQAASTDTRYYFYDRSRQQWRHSATIRSPNGAQPSVATIGGGLNSFLENFLGKDKTVVKLALYRLWLGPEVDRLQCLTRAKGDGIWGQTQDAYFLAAGDRASLNSLIANLSKKYAPLHFGGKGETLEPLANLPVPALVTSALKKLPRSPLVQDRP